MATRDMRTATVVVVETGARLEVAQGCRLSLGRHPDNDLVLDDPTVSRFHATLVWPDEAAYPAVIDLDSSNGVHVGGQRFPRATLAPGADVRVGGVGLCLTSVVDRSDPALIPDEHPSATNLVRLFTDARPGFSAIFRTPSELGERLLTLEGTRRTGCLEVLGAGRKRLVFVLHGGRILTAEDERGSPPHAVLDRLRRLVSGTLTFSSEFEPQEATLSVAPSELFAPSPELPRTIPIRRRRLG